MKRRNFIKKIGFAAGAPLAFQGVPLKLIASDSRMHRLASQSSNDNVLVILQMHGGNDSLNTFIPIENYSQYYSKRANIAIPFKSGRRTLIPLDSTVPSADQVGVHPDMRDFKDMYDNGMAAVFQGVSYERNNGSHFRGRDIWHMGGGPDDYFSSGWIGRYLKQEYAPKSYPDDFPNDEMPDPLALEMGNSLSLVFHQENNIPTSISLDRAPDSLLKKVEGLEGFVDDGIDPRGLPPTFLNDSPYGKEMDWILGLEDKSEIYIRRLAEIYAKSTETSVTYPDKYPFRADSTNPLSKQLKLVARLLEGGAKTKVFLVRIGGFDTHADQTEAGDPTVGSHAALLYHISTAMNAFQKDLEAKGLADKVLTMTMSEFGRRVQSNGSYGTDHGTGGALMLFGKHINAGIYGTNPDLNDRNIAMQFDYRQIYAGILNDWMGVDESTLTNDIFFQNFITGGTYQPLELISSVEDNFLKKHFKISNLHPNPATNYVQIEIQVNDVQPTTIELINISGSVVKTVFRNLIPGKHNVTFDLSNLPGGIYFIKAKSTKLNDTKRLFVRK
ncbi:DUF1501 domain-containing protein [Reichenbachiella versicolor]|uniref:DUF1501 domain-containing protein n=1 Tax=Reichenbachiella versicolor TaxID=1821036 RepID=UPI000D6E77E7|nr:DUF1501 domain-containing protein [Reichenbachiella versicolor]